MFGSGDLYETVEEYTQYEIALRDLQSAVDRCMDELPEISFEAPQDTASSLKRYIS